MNFGVIGYGYWGPNIVRNLTSLEGSRVITIADLSRAARGRAQKAHPGIGVTSDPMDVILATDIDAVAIVSPVWTHFELAKAALENGKHVFVEKPFTSTAAQGEELINLAQQKNLRIMVDHTFLFTGAVQKDQPAARGRNAGQALLLRFHTREPGPFPARCQRALGPGPP